MAVKKAKKSVAQELLLDNEITVTVRKLSEQDRMRAASIFDPKSINRAEKGKLGTSDALDLWTGNEAYTLFIVDRACVLLSEMPADDGWLRRIRRNRRAYGVTLDDLDDEDYLKVLYIRFEGMTTDEHIGRVTDIAMDIQEDSAPAKTEAGEEDEE